VTDEQQWTGVYSNGLVKLYHDTVATLLDKQVPLRTKKCRRQPSNPWFDDECRTEKHSLRSLDRTARCSASLSDTTHPAIQAWRAERRRYLSFIEQAYDILDESC